MTRRVESKKKILVAAFGEKLVRRNPEVLSNLFKEELNKVIECRENLFSLAIDRGRGNGRN